MEVKPSPHGSQKVPWLTLAIVVVVISAAVSVVHFGRPVERLLRVRQSVTFSSESVQTLFVSQGTDSVIAPAHEILLTESPSVINVNPRVSTDPVGGFLIADADESQLRRYSATGELLAVFGRRGRGPGEFERLATAIRTNDGSIAAVEMSGRISLVDSAAGKLLQTWQTELGPVYGGTRLANGSILLAGRRGGAMSGNLLHVFDLETGQIAASMFPMPQAPQRLQGTYAFAGTADAAVRGDTIAAVFALTDSVYLFTSGGERIETVPIPFRHFRPAREPIPLRASLPEYREWGSRFSAISRIYWTNQYFLIQYYDTDGIYPRWKLIVMSRRGEWRFEGESPQLLTVSPKDGYLYFVEPQSLTPNHWLAARLVER